MLILRRLRCCHPDGNEKPGPLNEDSSKRLVELIEENDLAHPEASNILREYLNANKKALWEDALREHELI